MSDREHLGDMIRQHHLQAHELLDLLERYIRSVDCGCLPRNVRDQIIIYRHTLAENLEASVHLRDLI